MFIPENAIQDPFTVYEDYCKVKAHFNSAYDLTKYNQKTKTISRKSFDRRHDRPLFFALSKILTAKENIPFFVAQIVDKADVYVLDIVEDLTLSQEIYAGWKYRNERLENLYKYDMQTLAKVKKSWVELLQRPKNDHSILQKACKLHKISPETYTLIIDLFGIKVDANNILDNDYKYSRYRPLLKISKKRVLEITPKTFNIGDTATKEN